MNQNHFIGLMELGSFSTSHYLKRFDELFQKSNVNRPYPIKLVPVDFETINQYLPDQFEQLEHLVTEALLKFDEVGVRSIVVPNITLHLTIDRIKLPKELLEKVAHPLKEGAKQLSKKGVHEITLFGTRHTMRQPLFYPYFTAHQIEVLRPNEHHIDTVDAIRLEVFEKGPTKKLCNALSQLLLKYPNPVIACTELSILLNGESDCFDLIEHQIMMAHRSILSQPPLD